MKKYKWLALIGVAVMAGSACSAGSTERKPEQGPDDQLIGAAPSQSSAAAEAPAAGSLDEVQIDGGDRGDLIRLRFGFPSSGSARVDTMITSGELPMGLAETLTFETDSEGLLHVVHSDFKSKYSTRTGHTKAQIDEMSRRVDDALRGTSYELVVDENAGIVGTRGLRAFYRAMKTAQLTPNRQVADLVKTLGMAIVKAGHTNKQPEEDWIMTVQFWDGQDLKVGERKSAHFRSYYGSISRGFHKVTIDVEYVATGRVPCSPQDAQRSCVRLRMSAVPDPQQLTLGARRFGATFRQEVPEQLERVVPPVKSLASHSDIELIVEPDTLLPHRYVKTVHDRLVLANGEVSEDSATFERNYQYR